MPTWQMTVASSRTARRSLRSADVPTCVVPRTYSSCGDRTFAAAGPRLWNSLPVQLHNPDISYGRFRRQLKGHLFEDDEHGALWPSICSAIEKRFTYLLILSQIGSYSVFTVIMASFLSASLYVSKRGAYWDRLCRDVVGRWLVVTRVHCGQTVHPRPIVTMEH